MCHNEIAFALSAAAMGLKKRCWTRIGAKPPCRVRRAKPEQDWGNPRRVRKRAEPNQKKRRGKASSQSAPPPGGHSSLAGQHCQR